MPRSPRFARRPGLGRIDIALVAVVVAGAVASGGILVNLSLQASPTTLPPLPSTVTSSTTSAAPLQKSATSSSSTTSVATSISSVPVNSSSGALDSSCPTNDTALAAVASIPLISSEVSSFGNLLSNASRLIDPAGPPLTNATATDLFGNFTQMTLSQSEGALFGPSLWSYSVVGRPVIGSLEYYNVSFTGTELGITNNYTALFAPNGTMTSIASPSFGSNESGTPTPTLNELVVGPFLLLMDESSLAGPIAHVPGLSVLNETTVSFGPTPTNVTYYGFKSLPLSICGLTIANFALGVGTPPGTKLPMLLVANEDTLEQGSLLDASASVTSLVPANP